MPLTTKLTGTVHAVKVTKLWVADQEDEVDVSALQAERIDHSYVVEACKLDFCLAV